MTCNALAALLMGACLLSCSSSQDIVEPSPYVVSGLVRDGHTGGPIDGVAVLKEIILDSGSAWFLEEVSQPDGSFRLVLGYSDHPATWEFQHPDYSPVRVILPGDAKRISQHEYQIEIQLAP